MTTREPQQSSVSSYFSCEILKYLQIHTKYIGKMELSRLPAKSKNCSAVFVATKENSKKRKQKQKHISYKIITEQTTQIKTNRTENKANSPILWCTLHTAIKSFTARVLSKKFSVQLLSVEVAVQGSVTAS